MSDPKPNGLILEKIRKTNKVRTGVQFRLSVAQLTPGHITEGTKPDIQATRVKKFVVAPPHEEEKKKEAERKIRIDGFMVVLGTTVFPRSHRRGRGLDSIR